MVDSVIIAALIEAGAKLVEGVLQGISTLNQNQRGNFTKALASKKFYDLGNVLGVVVTCQRNKHEGSSIQRDIMCGFSNYEIIVFYEPGFYENYGDGGYCNHALYGNNIHKVSSNRWEIS